MDTSSLVSILKVAWPLLLIEIGLLLYALIDVIRRKKTKTLSLLIWIVIIVLFEIIGPIAYLLFGKAED